MSASVPITGLTNRTGPSKVILGRDMMGYGDPRGDAQLISPTQFDVGSSYLDLQTGRMYYCTTNSGGTANTWVAQDVQS